jgi:CheY-like chemotaxis protein
MKTSASILLVDDQPDLLDNLSLTLGMAGYQAVTASDGFEALAVLQRQPVDLILSDITMPRLDGYQLYHRVRQNPEWAKIPFLFLTGCGFLSDGEIRYGKALGVDEYLSKPIRSRELLAAVQRVLQRTQ